MKRKDKDFYFDARDLSRYIEWRYFKKFGERISQIKLHKMMYFLFAYWGGFIKRGQDNPDYVEEDMSKYKKYLFDGRFEAWTYGPVLIDIYNGKN